MTPEPSADAAPPMSEAARITGAYLDPKVAFADIAARPRWYMPLLGWQIARPGVVLHGLLNIMPPPDARRVDIGKGNRCEDPV